MREKRKQRREGPRIRLFANAMGKTFKYLFFFKLCLCVYLCEFMGTTCMQVPRGQKVMDPLRLELQGVLAPLQ